MEVVKNGTIWYSAPCNFNDVFDVEFPVDFESIFNSIVHQVPNGIKLKKGSPAWKDLRKVTTQEVKKLKESLTQIRYTMGVTCLSELDDSLLMWAHYANNHKGMCVEYSLLDINRELTFTPVPVIYSDRRVRFESINIDNSETSTLEYFIECLTSKSTAWSYEREWRIIREETACGSAWNNEKHGALLKMIAPNSITLGCEAKGEFEAAVKEYCNSSKINLYKMKKDDLQYRLNRETILEFEER